MVRFLTTYAKNSNDMIASRVNIESEVKKYKLINKNESQPVVVFDFIGTIQLLFKDVSEAMCGGREGECIRRAEEIFEKLRNLDIELHFFLDGPIKRIKAPNWCSEKNDDYDFLKPILANFTELNASTLKMQRFLKTHYENYLRVAKKWGNIFISLDNECDMDIVEHAIRVQAMAVLANDSDFMVMPGDFSFWLASSLDLKTMSVEMWNKKTLRASLKLEQWQMPLLGTLLSNNFLLYEHVVYFHDKLRAKGHRMNNVKLIRAIADLVRSNFKNPEEKDLALKLADIVYDRVKSKISLNEIVRFVQISLDFFDYETRIVRKLEPDWLRDHVLHTASFIVFTMYTQGVLFITQPYIGFSENTLPYADLVLPLLRRELGIMYYSRRNDANEIKQDICLKRSENEPFAMHQYTPIYPDFDAPPMDDILSDDEDRMPLERRLEIFAWIVGPNKESLKLESIQKLLRTIYILPSIVTNYLYQMEQITVDEADSLLLTIFEANGLNPAKSEILRPPDHYAARPFLLSFIYTNLIRHFEDAMKFCGLNEFVPYAYYDGYIFHRVYKKLAEASCEDKKKELEPIAEYRLYSL